MKHLVILYAMYYVCYVLALGNVSKLNDYLSRGRLMHPGIRAMSKAPSPSLQYFFNLLAGTAKKKLITAIVVGKCSKPLVH